jgi:pyruvate/2-oxoglutarate dehydrogenase complex dihydrolipoamide dehydrogenase (E3) component
VAFGERGVQVDDRLRTTNPRIYAAGDVTGRFQFTHAADAMARIVVRNALFFGRQKFSDTVIPWCTFTDPELAHVGVASEEAARHGARTITVLFDDVDRAVIDDDTNGFVRVHHDRGRIVGATIVAPEAGNLISVVTSVMQRKGTLSDLSSVVFPYPTTALALKRVGDIYRRETLTPGLKRALRYYFHR